MDNKKIDFNKGIPFSVQAITLGKYPMHSHEDLVEILLPIKGSTEVYVNFEHILIKEGDFWIINNNSIHSITSSSDSIVIMFHIDLNYFEKDFEHIKYMYFRSNMYSKGRNKTASDNYDDEIRKGNKTRFRNLLLSVLTDSISNDPLAKDLIRDSIYQLVSSMVKEFNWLQFLKKSSDLISPMQMDRYHRIIKYIDEHYMEKITLEDISKEEYISENYLSHFWKDLSNFSFMERVNYERVLKSEFLLLNTDKSIANIAIDCGFSDVKYYYKHFKKWYGTSPNKHRNRCKSYMSEDFNYSKIELSEIEDLINNYIKNIVMEGYSQNHIWKPSSLFDDFIRMKYLYRVDKINPQRSPRNAIINLFSSKNFKTQDNNAFFNWQNIDLLVNFSETSSFDINIKLDCKYLDMETSKYVIYNFINSCIYRYRIVTIEKWNFIISYYDDISLEQANIMGNIIEEKIKKAKITYYFEI